MRIGLIDVDSKIPNLALMKLSAWHKARGDKVEFFNALQRYDRVYASKIFDFTEDFKYWPDCETVKGGSGYSLETELSDEIEHAYPDYEFYGCDYAMGFITRGCIRNCPFCIVPKKEGLIHQVADIEEFWNGQGRLMLLDNNLTAAPNVFEKSVPKLIDLHIRVDFNQGLDVRLINDSKAKLLSRVRLWKQIHLAWDNVKDEKEVLRGLEILLKYNSPKRLMVYVLIGFDSTPTEDLYRVETLREMRLDSFAMPFNRRDPYQRDFARWVNHKAIFKSVSWSDYVANTKKKRRDPKQLEVEWNGLESHLQSG